MKKVLTLFSLFLLVSCNDAVVFNEKGEDFPDNRWLKNDAKTFEFEIKEDVAAAKLFVELSHVHEPGFNSIPVIITLQAADGTVQNTASSLELKDAAGDYISDCLGDICDLKQLVIDNANLPKGTYSITVENNFPAEYLPNVIRLGISIEKSTK